MRKFSWLLTVGAALLLFGSLAQESTGDSSGCEVFDGTVTARSVPRFDGEELVGFDVTGTGATGQLADLAVTAAFDVERFLEDGSVMISGSHTFEGGAYGRIVTADSGLTTGTGQVVNRMNIIEGGSGFLMTHGPIDLETGELTLDYLGVRCAAGGA